MISLCVFTGKYYYITSERCDNILSSKRYSKFRIQKNIEVVIESEHGYFNYNLSKCNLLHLYKYKKSLFASFSFDMCICRYITFFISIQKYAFFSAIHLLLTKFMRRIKNDLEKISKSLYLFKVASIA